MAIKGMPVTLYEKALVSTDPFNAPVYEEIPVVVENVLVSPASDTDMVNAMQLYGKHAVYTLAIPKGDAHNWMDTTVEFFGQKWHTFGFGVAGIDANIPLSWNKKVQVEAYG